MTREDIIRMAQECHLIGMRPHLDGLYQESIEKFAALVAAHEREECAKVCEAIYSDPEGNNGYDAYYTRPYLECAEAIRARGQE